MSGRRLLEGERLADHRGKPPGRALGQRLRRQLTGIPPTGDAERAESDEGNTAPLHVGGGDVDGYAAGEAEDHEAARAAEQVERGAADAPPDRVRCP